jgi:hypothetical protein
LWNKTVINLRLDGQPFSMVDFILLGARMMLCYGLLRADVSSAAEAGLSLRDVRRG